MSNSEIKDRLFLKKVEDTYVLHRIKDGVLTIEGDSSYDIRGIEPFYRLSLKNCQAIERGWDIDEINAEVDLNIRGLRELIEDSDMAEFYIDVVKIMCKDFFFRGMALFDDKKFSEEDMMNCWNEALTFKIHKKTFREFIQSLQQNEWNVEIVMEEILGDEGIILHAFGEKTIKPKFDVNGCIILKRK